MSDDYTPQEREQIEAYKRQIELMGWAAIRSEVFSESPAGDHDQVCLGLQRELLPSGKALPEAYTDPKHPAWGTPESRALIPPEDDLWLQALAEVAGDSLLVTLPRKAHQSGEPSIWIEPNPYAGEDA